MEKEPTFPRILSHVMGDERELGNLSLDVGDLEGAERHYGEALRLAREMLAADPTLPWFQLELAVNQQLLGELALRKERLNEAGDYFNDALTILDRLVSLDPITVAYQGELWRACHRLSRLAELRGEEASALDYRKRAFSIAEDLMERSPLELAHPRSMLLDSRILAEEAFERGDMEAVKSWEAKNLKAFRHLAESERVAAGDLNEYAWFLLTCRTPEFRDPETALEHGLRASRMLNDEDAATLDTVALAYYMTGDHEAAVKAQQKAIELLEAGGSEVHEDFRGRLRRYEDAAGRTNN